MDRIGDLYLAHKAMAAAEPATQEHAAAQAGFEQALAAIDIARTQTRGPGLHPAAKKVLATLDREWEGLARHRDFPGLDLDNNKSERALRTPVVGRKNYYGSHAEWSAHLAARVWTITATAERHHHEPLAYLTGYLSACADAGGKAPAGPALHRALPSNTRPRHRRQPRPRPAQDQPARLTRAPEPRTILSRTIQAPGHQHGRAFTMPSHGITEYLDCGAIRALSSPLKFLFALPQQHARPTARGHPDRDRSRLVLGRGTGGASM